MTPKKFTNEDKLWIDDHSIPCPVTRIKKSEKLKEKEAFNLATDALRINKALVDFKAKIQDICNKVYEAVSTENNIKKDTKGNYTWFNYNRSIKVETNISERIDFDGMLIEMCKAKLNEFIDKNLSGVDELVKNLVNDAFQNTKGKLDSKKVLSLLKYRSKIKHQDFQDALDLLEKSIFRPSSKQYFRIAIKDDSGEFKYVEMNFSNV